MPGEGRGRGPMGVADGRMPIIPDNFAELQEKSDSEEIDKFDFTIQFVWRQTSLDRMELFRKLHRQFQQKSEPTFESAKQEITDQFFSKEDFDAYVELHRPSTTPETAEN